MEIDYQIGIEYSGKDEVCYRQSLRDFYKNNKERQEKLSALISRDFKQYTIEVHALKSQSRSIGAMMLGEIAYEHEMKAKAGEVNWVSNNFSELIEKWKLVNLEIEEYLQGDLEEKISQTGIAIGESEVEKVLFQVKEALESYQFDEAEESLKNLLSYELPEKYKEKVPKAYEALEDFEYQEAIKIIS